MLICHTLQAYLSRFYVFCFILLFIRNQTFPRLFILSSYSVSSHFLFFCQLIPSISLSLAYTRIFDLVLTLVFT